MMNLLRIEPGDTVTVVFSHTSNPPSFFRGVVQSMPQATGDCWVLVDDRNEVHHVQTFQEIVRYANT